MTNIQVERATRERHVAWVDRDPGLPHRPSPRASHRDSCAPPAASPSSESHCLSLHLTVTVPATVTLSQVGCGGLPLAPAESVVSLVATLSGQSLASVRDLHKREATFEYSLGVVFLQSGMATHSYATLLAGLTWWFGLSSPAADQRPAAALREAPPNSDGSEGKLAPPNSDGRVHAVSAESGAS